MWKNKRLLLFFLIAHALINQHWAYAVKERPKPIIPPPEDVIYPEIKPQPYTRLMHSERYGDFYFTIEAEEDFERYVMFCERLGIRKEITEKINISESGKMLQIQYVLPSGDVKEISINFNVKDTYIKWRMDSDKNVHIIIDYPHEDYIIKIILDSQRGRKVLLAEYIMKYTMEIPMAGLVKGREIKRLILPPEQNVLLLDINRDLIYEYNRNNISLIDNINNPDLKPDQIDDIIQSFIANAIYHPLGKFSLGIKGKRILLAAEVLGQRILIPLECVNIPLNRLIKQVVLKKFFPGEESSNISDTRILNLIHERTRSLPSGRLKLIEEFPLREDWYVITTPNSCFWTDYFTSYIENQVKLTKGKIDFQVPIHLHPWHSLRWLLNDPFGRYWLTQYSIHLTPSMKDIGFFKGRYPESKLYIILAKNIYSDQIDWAIYDDLDNIEKTLAELYRFQKHYKGGPLDKKDVKKIKLILEKLRKEKAAITDYYIEQKQKLIVEPNIDKLLDINKQQLSIQFLIDNYRSNRPWRLTNFSLTVPLLNKFLESKGRKVISSEGPLGYDAAKKQFYYNPELITRMDLALFIMFELCYIGSENLRQGIEKEKELIDILKDIIHQLDYLTIKYHHFNEFCEYVRYLSNIMHYYLWEREKMYIIAREQLQNEGRVLDRYKLGYYPMISRDELKLLSEISMDSIADSRIIDLESLIKELSMTHSIKNEEEFILEFEKRLVNELLYRYD